MFPVIEIACLAASWSVRMRLWRRGDGATVACELSLQSRPR